MYRELIIMDGRISLVLISVLSLMYHNETDNQLRKFALFYDAFSSVPYVSFHNAKYSQCSNTKQSISLVAYGHLPANFVRHFSTTVLES